MLHDASGQDVYRSIYIALIYPLISVVKIDNFVFRSGSYGFYNTGTRVQHT
jgi:hypothetical protein